MTERNKQASDIDRLENQAKYLETRVGKPDFVGTYQDGKFSHRNFRMYILSQKEGGPNLHFRATFGLEDMPIKGEEIEGVILDNIGLAIFSGWKSEDVLTFVKTYAKSGRANGGAANALYQGQYDKVSKSYRGKFALRESDSKDNVPSGEFEIRIPHF